MKINFNNRKLTNLIVIIGILLTLCTYFFAIFIIELNRSFYLSRELNKKNNILKGYEKNVAFFPSREMVDYLNKKKNTLESFFKQFSSIFSTEEVKDAGSIDPLKFKEELLQAQKRTRDMASEAGLTLPNSLGFSRFDTEIPKTGEIPTLKNQLEIIQEIIKLTAESGIKSIDNIEIAQPIVSKSEPKENILPGEVEMPDFPLAKSQKAPKKAEINKEIPSEIVYDTFPIKLEVQSSTGNLAKFMYKLRTSKHIFVIKNLKINSVENASWEDRSIIKASLDLNTIIFAK